MIFRPEAWVEYVSVILTAAGSFWLCNKTAAERVRRLSKKVILGMVSAVSLVFWAAYGTRDFDDPGRTGNTITQVVFHPTFQERCFFGLAVFLILMISALLGDWFGDKKKP